MPVKNIHFNSGHRVEVSLDDVNRLPMARDINEKASPAKTRLIHNAHGGYEKGFLIQIDKLQKGLQPSQNAYGRSGCQTGALLGHVKRVGLICAGRPNRLSGSAAVNLKSSRPGIRRRRQRQGNSGFVLEALKKSRGCFTESRIPAAC
jgi:hypothetical protein